jgi:hypothetical protein
MNLGKDIRKRVRHGTQMPAVVIDVVGSSASARLSANGAIYRNLSVVGGPAQIGDPCYVDLTTPKPTIVMVSKSWLTEDDLNRALRRLQFGLGTGFDIDRIWVFAPGAGATPYSRDGSGLYDALQGASSGSKVVVPAGEISGSFEIPKGVELEGMGAERTRIFGVITGADQASMNGIWVQSSSAYAAIGPSTGKFYVYKCVISACQGTGFHQPSGGQTDIQYSSLIGEGGYAAKNDGTLNVRHSGVYGLTDWFDGNVNVYSITEINPICESQELLSRNVSGYSLGSFYTQTNDADTQPCLFDSNATLNEAIVRSESVNWAHQAVSSNKHIYSMAYGQPSIQEFEIASESVINTYSSSGWDIAAISLRKDREVILLRYNDQNVYNLVVYNFSTGAENIVWESDANKTYYEICLVSYNASGTVKTALVMMTMDEYYNQHCVLNLYNGSTVVETKDEIIYYCNSFFIYSQPAIVNGKLIFNVVTVAQDSNDRFTIFYIFDFLQGTLTSITHKPVNGSWGTPEVYEVGGHPDLNRLYFTMYYREAAVDLSIGYIDLSDNSITFLRDTSSLYWQFVWGKDKCYTIEISTTTTYVYEATDIDNELFIISDLGGKANITDGMSANLDENGRIWVWDNTNQKLLGYNIETGNYITLDTTISKTTVSPNRVPFSLHGNKFLFNIVRPSSGIQRLYLLYPSEA